MVDMKLAYEYIGRQAVGRIVSNLRRYKFTGSGGSESAIAGTIGAEMKVTKNGVQIYADDYWVHLEDGTKARGWSFKRGDKGGQSPFINSIREWIKWKGLKPKLSQKRQKLVEGRKKGEAKKQKQSIYEQGYTSMAFAIANKINKKGTIKRFGYKGSKVFSKSLDDVFVTQMEDFLARYIENNL